MAKVQQKPAPAGTAASAVDNRYHTVLIDRGFAAEASRRNIEIIVWYKRLINATLALVVVASFFSIMAVAFAWLQPLPKLYGSAMDGALRPIDYVRSPADPRLATMRAGLIMEEASRLELAKPSVDSVRSQAPAAPAAPGAAAPAAQK